MLLIKRDVEIVNFWSCLFAIFMLNYWGQNIGGYESFHESEDQIGHSDRYVCSTDGDMSMQFIDTCLWVCYKNRKFTAIHSTWKWDFKESTSFHKTLVVMADASERNPVRAKRWSKVNSSKNSCWFCQCYLVIIAQFNIIFNFICRSSEDLESSSDDVCEGEVECDGDQTIERQVINIS